MSDAWDVVIVGSGAAGGAVAYGCAAAGLKTLVVEKGKEYRRADYTHDELAICRRDFFVPYMADEPRTLRDDAGDDAVKSNYAWISCCVGGGTIHWSGFSYRFAPSDFAEWPVTYATMEPYYGRAEALLGVTRDLNVHPLAKVLEAALRKGGVATERSPRAILTKSSATRGACTYCDYCGSYGCETGAKGSSQEALLAPARATGRCDVWPATMTTAIVTGRGKRAAGIVVRRADGTRQQIDARVVVVAASAIESARLLLISKVESASGLIGKGLMFLTVANGEATFVRKPRASAEAPRDPADALFDARAPFLDVTARTPYGILNYGFAHPNPIFNAEKLAGAGASAVWGRALVGRLRTHFREGLHVDYEGYTPCTRLDSNRVDLDPEVRDRYGLPVARITFKRAESDRAKSATLARRGAELLRLCGADRVEEPSAGESLAVVQSGTCRMGRDEATSVVDANGRLHGYDNLYVADSSVFPSSGSVPHTLTIVANALRVGDGIAQKLKG